MHFSTKPVKGKEPAKLPEVDKVNIDQQIKRIKAQTPKNCASHGGIDCEAGKDGDGSVICMDGFKGSVLSFSKKCGQARLQVDSAKFTENYEYIELFIRNLSPVEAEGIQAYGRVRAQPKKKAFGPTKVEAYSVGEYKIPLGVRIKDIAPPFRVYSYTLKCENCDSEIQKRLKIQ